MFCDAGILFEGIQVVLAGVEGDILCQKLKIKGSEICIFSFSKNRRETIIAQAPFIKHYLRQKIEYFNFDSIMFYTNFGFQLCLHNFSNIFETPSGEFGKFRRTCSGGRRKRNNSHLDTNQTHKFKVNSHETSPH